METIEAIMGIALCMLLGFFILIAIALNELKRSSKEIVIKHIYQMPETAAPVVATQEEHEYEEEQEKVIDAARAIQHIFLDVEERGDE